MSNLAEALQAQITRNQELLTAYQSIPAGAFGAAFIKQDLQAASKAIAEDDIVGQMRVYERLKANN